MYEITNLVGCTSIDGHKGTSSADAKIDWICPAKKVAAKQLHIPPHYKENSLREENHLCLFHRRVRWLGYQRCKRKMSWEWHTLLKMDRCLPELLRKRKVL